MSSLQVQLNAGDIDTYSITRRDAAAAAALVRHAATDSADQLWLMQALDLAPYEAWTTDGHGRRSPVTRTPNIR